MQEDGLVLGQLNNKSLRERVLDVLREAILHGDLKPGQPLIETDLAAQLGVSRAPLREAIQVLNKEGLVETIPYHGTTVRRLSTTDIEELYSLRGALEAFAISRIIACQDHAAVAADLHAIYEHMLQAANMGDLKRVNEIDRDFHDALIHATGHRLLITTWRSVSLRVRQIMALRNMRNSDLKQVAYNHQPIIEALAVGDAVKAEVLIKAHVASAGDLALEGWIDQYGEDTL
jgi:DNA-binding GntR family transcriptional regulator